MLHNFYFHPRMMSYDFGPQHPLKPDRLRRTIDLLAAVEDLVAIDPGPGDVADVLRVHDPEFVQFVAELSEQKKSGKGEGGNDFGFGPGDNPPFAGMYEASLAYVAGTAAAARSVTSGSQLAYGISGGLHHARRREASGFCIFNDPAIACHLLLERFDRVAYVDIDVHHGDGVQWIWYDDTRVLTCSIHEDPRSLYPGTGFVTETGAQCTALNVPLLARTTGDVWLWAFEQTILPALDRFAPQAIVIQMGTDSHFLDPLGHLLNSAQEWTQAVAHVRDFGVPIVAVGGGGYNLTTVPRMWTAACMTLANDEVPDRLPEPFASQWEVPWFYDRDLPGPLNSGRAHAEEVVEYIRGHHLNEMPRGA